MRLKRIPILTKASQLAFASQTISFYSWNSVDASKNDGMISIKVKNVPFKRYVLIEKLFERTRYASISQSLTHAELLETTQTNVSSFLFIVIIETRVLKMMDRHADYCRGNRKLPNSTSRNRLLKKKTYRKLPYMKFPRKSIIHLTRTKRQFPFSLSLVCTNSPRKIYRTRQVRSHSSKTTVRQTEKESLKRPVWEVNTKEKLFSPSKDHTLGSGPMLLHSTAAAAGTYSIHSCNFVYICMR